MTSPRQSSGNPPAIEDLLSDSKTPAVSTTEEVSPSPPTAAEEDPKGLAKEEVGPYPPTAAGDDFEGKPKGEPEKDLVKGSSADIKKQLLNKWLEDCQRIIFLTIAFVSSEMTNSSAPQEHDLLDKMKHDIGMTQSAIEFVVKYDVKEYVNKEQAEAKLMEATMLIRVQVEGMREVLMRRGCRNVELHGFWGRRCDCFDLADPFFSHGGRSE